MTLIWQALLWLGFMATCVFIAVGGLLGPPSTWVDHVLPDEALTGIGRVSWRKPYTAAQVVAAGGIVARGGFCASGRDLYGDPNGWVPWPQRRDLLPVDTAPRGGISYERVWTDA